VAGITPAELTAIGDRLEAFAADVFESLPRTDQRARGECYLRGLLLDGRRKSIEPMAQRLGEVHYQALHHFVAASPWDWRPVRRRLAGRLCRAIEPTWLSNLPEATPMVELAGEAALASGAGLSRAQGRPRLGPLRGPQLWWLASSRDLDLGRPRLFDLGAAAPPETGGVGLTLWQLVEQLQVLLACWAGACPTCRRPAPHWLSRQGRSRAPT
jgi:hypothetical protein